MVQSSLLSVHLRNSFTPDLQTCVFPASSFYSSDEGEEIVLGSCCLFLPGWSEPLFEKVPQQRGLDVELKIKRLFLVSLTRIIW